MASRLRLYQALATPVLLPLLWLFALYADAEPRLNTVTLQLKWTHAFQFAGYYAAREKGFYREAGLDVDILEAKPDTDPIQQVVSGQAHFGVGSSSLLLARRDGLPVVVLAVIFQHSPLVLISRLEHPSQTVSELAGKRIMLEPQSEELLAYLKAAGIAPETIVTEPHSFDVKDLIEGRIDAMSAYQTFEPYYLEERGIPVQSYSPRSAGIDFYGDNLFTSARLLREQPQLVKAFREASLRGWEYAMAHPDEIIDLILTRYTQRHPRALLEFEAQRMRNLLYPDMIEIGYMKDERWRHIAQTYASLGLLPDPFDLRGFLYRPTPPRTDFTWLYVASALALLACLIALHTWRTNRQLDQALAASRQAEERIRHMARHDPLTGLPNRTLFSERLSQALTAARQANLPLAVLFIDLDRFKEVNDTFGHAVGDELLREATRRMQACLHSGDTLARIGGDEFIAVLCGRLDAEAALQVAKQLQAVLRQPFPLAGTLLDLSSSIGVALYPDHGHDEIELCKYADLAMYQAKKGGRDSLRIYGKAACCAE